MIKQLRKSIRRKLASYFLEFYTIEELREKWPAVRQLEDKNIAKCRLLTNRNEMLKYMPKNKVCAEVGIFECDYSRIILKITNPEKLHLIDMDRNSISIANELFKTEVENNQIELHQGDSSTILKSFPDSYFDWIYIDGDHSYEGIKKRYSCRSTKSKTRRYAGIQ